MHIQLKHAVNVRSSTGRLHIVLRGKQVNYSRKRLDEHHVEHRFSVALPNGQFLEHKQVSVKGAVPSWL
jgi:hypothetical protein